MNARKDNSRFQRARGMGTGGTYKCDACGKLTRETGDEESQFQLCRSCLRDTYWTNYHSDECHEGPRENCKACAENGYTKAYVKE